MIMNILTAENLTKTYGEKILFSDISFGIEEGEKIGIIGVNGTGKTTLLKALAGVEYLDNGKITVGSNINVEYLPQNPEFEDDITVLQQVFRGSSPLMQTLREYEAALEKLNADSSNASYQRVLMQLSQKMDELNAWQIESEAKTILSKLGISQFDTRVGTLSGGQRKRVAMASALITPADLLILDEPTNHIDNETVDWLEQYLNKRKGALLMITHDRYFLNRVVNRIFELDHGKLYPYPGNYSRYLELKAEREEQEESSERKRQNRLRNELAWIRRGAKARSTKQKARIERFEQLQADKPTDKNGKIEITAGFTRLGKKIVECSHLHKQYPGRGVVINDFSIILSRHDRIGIIGPNGSGKSTLLNLLAGRIQPDKGNIDWGPTVKIGYFAQENTDLDPKLKVIDVIKAVAEVIPTPDGGVITASQMLERFLFTPSQQWTLIEKLSGGERRRLYLLQVLMNAPNVLLLDEPTNDLDIQTLRILEEYLDDFPGVVVVVSHDRYFLDRVAEKILAFEGKGEICSIVGNYTEYREHLERITNKSQEPSEINSLSLQRNLNSSEKSDEFTLSNTVKPKERPLKMSFKEQREYEQIEGLIAEVEEELGRIAQQINAAGSDYGRLNELVKEQKVLETKLDEHLERWTYLNELAERIAQAKAGY